MHGKIEAYVPGKLLVLDEQASSVRTLALASGTIGGFLVAASAQVLLFHKNIELATMWQDLFASSTVQIRSALAWWLLAGTALIGGFVVAAATRFLITNWWPLRLLRWILGAALVAGLAAVGHAASQPAAIDSAAYLAANLSSMTASVLAASVGAFFAARR
jgi:hypothetical protein